MAKRDILIALFFLVMLTGIVLIARGSDSSEHAKNSMNSTVTFIKLGTPEKTDLYGLGSSVDNHFSGAIFYQHDWVQGNLGIVKFEHGKHDVVIDNALSALGSADKDIPGGIFDWNVNFGVSGARADTPEVALARMTSFFQNLRDKGWNRYIDSDYPRLAGKSAWNYERQQDLYSLDSTYTPTLDEWKAVLRDQPCWRFYADGVYLDVSIVESNVGEFVGKSVYIVSAKFQNEFDFYGIGYFPGEPEKIKRWTTLLPAELKKYHEKRLRAEATLKSQGYTIDTTYQDPPIKALHEDASSSQ